MKDQIPNHAADMGAAISTATVATYAFSDILSDAALVVAIISGSLAAAWHIYKFYQEFRGKRNDAKSTDDK